MTDHDLTQRTGCEKVRMTDSETGREVWRLTNSPWHDKHAYYDVSPWNPIDGRIVFSSARPEDLPDPSNRALPTQTGHVYTMDSDGGNITWLTGGAPFNLHVGVFAEWTPDGRGLIYGDEANDCLRTFDLATGETRSLQGVFPRQLSPDGRKIACHNRSDGMVIVSMHSLEREMTVTFDEILAAASHCQPGGSAQCTREDFSRLVVANTKWSPDGNKLILRFSGIYRHTGDSVKELYAMNADGTELRCIDVATDRFHHHSWHPDGERILFAARVESGEQRLFFVDWDGSNLEMVADENLGGHPCLDPEGRRIVTEARGGLVLLDIASGSVEKLVSYPGHAVPTNPHAVWSRDGSQILYDSSETGTCQLYLLEMT